MPALDERVASLEARMDRTNDLFTLIADLRGDMNRQITELRADLNRQVTELRADMNRHFADVRSGLGLLHAKVDRDFRWAVGIQLTVLTAVMSVLLAALFRQVI